MAFKKKTRRNRQERRERGHVAPLPHPSWRIASAAAVGGIPVASATEFWSRLDL